MVDGGEMSAMSVEEIAKKAVGKKLFADIKNMNAIGKAFHYDNSLLHVQCDGHLVHIADKVASDNLRVATEDQIIKSIKVQERNIKNQQSRKLARIAKGRTRGTGAGGYNRDIGNIEHRLDDAKCKIDILKGELLRRHLAEIA